MSSGNKYKDETLKHVSRMYLLKAIMEGRWDDASTIVYNDESYARVPDEQGYLPLHLSVRLGCPSRLAVLLITAYPDSIRLKDRDGFLPLHLAARHYRGKLWISILELAQILHQAYPRGIRERDRDGNLPIHLALRSNGPDEIIRYLLDEWPESVHEHDQRGNLPLHLAIQFDASYVMVFQVLKNFPDATKHQNNFGALPLHKAAFFNVSIEILELVLTANPQGAFCKDKNFNLPIHLAYLNAGGPPDEPKLKLWLQANALGLSVRNKNNCTPIMMFQRPQDNSLQEYL
jgi:ankyrin repeat protein